MKKIFLLIIASVAILQGCSSLSFKESEAFLRDMYNLELYQDYDFLEEHCSQSVLQKLSDDYDYDSDGEVAYAVWDFRSGCQDGPEETHEFTGAKEKDGWIVYTGIDLGVKFSCSVKLAKEDGKIIITDLIPGTID